ncbi:unnamed protein product [Closterium sp. NIES-53]
MKSRCPAPPCPACRAALLATAPPFAACAPPFAARRADLSSPRAAICSPRAALLLLALPCPRAALLAAAPPFAARAPPLADRAPPIAPVRRPAAARPATRSPAGRHPTARTALLRTDLLLAPPGCCPPCCAQPCWLAPSSPRRPAAARPAPLSPLSPQHKTTKALYDAVVARYSSPATAALGCLILPYLFPELSAFATVEDLVTHLRTSDARYRAALPAEFLDRNPPPMDHFLALDPTDLTDDLLEKHLLAAETSLVAVGATHGTPRTPFFEGCPPSPLALSYASAAAIDILGAEDVGAASALSGKRRNSKGKGGKSGSGGSGGGGGGGSGGGGGGEDGGSGGSGGGSGGFGGGGSGSGGGGVAAVAAVGLVAAAVVAVGVELFSGEVLAVARGSNNIVGARPLRPSIFTCGKFHSQHRYFSRLDDAWRAKFGDEDERPSWSELLRSRVDIFALDYDAILAAMYALSVSAEGDCYLCVPPDPGIGASEFSLPSTAPVEALHTFTLDSGASRCFFRDSTTLTPLPAPVLVRLADTSGVPVLARSSTVLPCPAVPSGSLLGLHLPSFSTNLVSTAALHDAMVTTTTPGGQRVSICTCTRTGRHLATFTRRSGSTLYTLTTKPPQRAAPHSSSFPPTTAPLQTLHMDVWGPARVSGQDRERYFLLVVDNYTRYTIVFPLCSKGEDFPVLHLQSDRGGEFSSDLLREFCRGEGILQSFTLPASPQQNGVAEGRIGLVMELNLWPRVSLPETSPTLRWTGKVGDASVFRVWGSRAFVRDTSADKLSPRYSLLGSLLPSLPLPHCPSPPPPLLFLTPGPPPVDPLPPQGPAPSGVARGAASGGAASWGAVSRSAEPASAESGGAEPEGAELGGTETKELELETLALEALELETLEPEALVLEALKLEGLELETLALEALELEALELETLELEVLALGVLKLAVLLQQESPLPAPSLYAEQTYSFTEPREPESRPASRVRAVRTGRCVPCPRPPPVPGTHVMAPRPSSVPLRVPPPSPPASSLPDVPEPESDLARAASPTVPRLLATVVTDPSFEPAAAFALVAELVDFTAACCLNYATRGH